MTKKEAIENHRKMWNWIADETERQQRIVTKAEYFRSIGFEPLIANNCYCCEYVSSSTVESSCEACPIKWSDRGPGRCSFVGSPYFEWARLMLYWDLYHKTNWKRAAECAREIANLPEREDVQNERVGIPEDSES